MKFWPVSIKEAKCNAKKCDYFFIQKKNIFGVNSYGLVSPDLIIEKKKKKRTAGSTGPFIHSNTTANGMY